eukprot:11961657-Ditylum_brightwellii.AAC.1
MYDWKAAQKRKWGRGGSLVKSKDTATDRDSWTIWILCIWSSRLSEVSTIAKSHIKAKDSKM